MFKKLIKTMGVIGCTTGLLLPSIGSAHAATPQTKANDRIFGPNVYVFDSSMSDSQIQSIASSVYSKQEKNQFASQGYALLFKPGTYNVDMNEGYYTEVAGLGLNPNDVKINGGVNVDAKWFGGNATQNFWRSIENIEVNPTANKPDSTFGKGTMQWAASQMDPLRRVHINGNVSLYDYFPNGSDGWASGGFIADSVIDGTVNPGSQQQYLSRNNQYGNWTNGNWNMVFVGDQTPPTGTWPSPAYTTVDKTPKMAEKPYLYIDKHGEYKIFVPSLQTNAKGISWENGNTPGKSLSINQFLIAFPNTPVEKINEALKRGKNLIFTPGTYDLKQTIQITRPNTIVMGLGFPTLVADGGQEAIKVGNVGGVRISGLIVDAGAKRSPSLMTIGTAQEKTKGHENEKNFQKYASNPTILYDMTYRVGGARPGLTDSSLVINNDNVIGDNLWLWRADHGNGVGWNINADKNGLIVNGDNVTMYGLFNEHHEQYQTLWNGNGGKVYFYQSEDPYDVPSQAAWMSHNGTVNGYASYKVADHVTSNEVWGAGVYSVFQDAPVKQFSAIEVPDFKGIKVHHMITAWLGGVNGNEITHIINNLGNTANSWATMFQRLDEFQGSK